MSTSTAPYGRGPTASTFRIRGSPHPGRPDDYDSLTTRCRWRHSALCAASPGQSEAMRLSNRATRPKSCSRAPAGTSTPSCAKLCALPRQGRTKSAHSRCAGVRPSPQWAPSSPRMTRSGGPGAEARQAPSGYPAVSRRGTPGRGVGPDTVAWRAMRPDVALEHVGGAMVTPRGECHPCDVSVGGTCPRVRAA